MSRRARSRQPAQALKRSATLPQRADEVDVWALIEQERKAREQTQERKQ